MTASLRAAVLLFAGIVWPSAVVAAEFKWTAPAGCPDQETVEHRVTDALGMPLVNAAPLTCVANVEQRGPSLWLLTLELSKSSEPATVQRRSLEAVSCDKLAEAAAVALSLALGQAASESRESAVTEPAVAPVEPTPIEPSATPPPTKEKPKPPTSEAFRFWWSAGLVALLDRGTLPGLAPGVEAAGKLGYRSVGMRVTGLILPEQSSNETGPGGDFSLMAGSLAMCGFSGTDGRLALCAGAEVGQLRGVGTHVTTQRSGHSLWLAPRADVGWSIRLAEGFAFLVQGGVVTPLIQKDFKLGNAVVVHRPDSLVWRLGLGVHFNWR